MRLSEARLCLDCDEVHSDAHCPVCASESFAFIKRWVATPERRPKAASAPTDTSSAETVATYRALLAANGDSRVTTGRLLRGGAVGLAILGAAGWFLQRNLREKNGAAAPPPSAPSADASDRSTAA
jgi:hypothetical protein